MLLPFKTCALEFENYGEGYLDLGTIKNFPYRIEHVIFYAREIIF